VNRLFKKNILSLVQQTPIDTFTEILDQANGEMDFFKSCILFNSINANKLSQSPTDYSTLVQALIPSELDFNYTHKAAPTNVYSQWNLQDVLHTIEEIK
jgi:hypothetical protein